MRPRTTPVRFLCLPAILAMAWFLAAAPALADPMGLGAGAGAGGGLDLGIAGSTGGALSAEAEMPLGDHGYLGLWAARGRDGGTSDGGAFIGLRGQTPSGLFWDISYAHDFMADTAPGEVALFLQAPLAEGRDPVLRSRGADGINRLSGFADLAWTPGDGAVYAAVGLTHAFRPGHEIWISRDAERQGGQTVQQGWAGGLRLPLASGARLDLGLDRRRGGGTDVSLTLRWSAGRG